jgi:hypothetical protein
MDRAHDIIDPTSLTILPGVYDALSAKLAEEAASSSGSIHPVVGRVSTR